MSQTGRVLAFVERIVSAEEREHYLADVAARRARAGAVQAHFWVFEHGTDAGRFVEFTEAADAAAVAHAHDGVLPASVWREVQGG